MNPAGNPEFVAAEMAYRYETGHITRAEIPTDRPRGHRLLSWVRRHRPHEALRDA